MQKVVSTRLVQGVLLTLWVLGALVHLTFRPREILLCWNEDDLGTLRSLRLVKRLCTGVRVEDRVGFRDAMGTNLDNAQIDNQVVVLVDLPGLSNVQEFDGMSKRIYRYLYGWKFGLGVYEVEISASNEARSEECVQVNQIAHDTASTSPLHSTQSDSCCMDVGTGTQRREAGGDKSRVNVNQIALCMASMTFTAKNSDARQISASMASVRLAGGF